MAEMRCSCGKTIRYADDMHGTLSCPYCGETLARFGAEPTRRIEEVADEAGPDLEHATPERSSEPEPVGLPPRLSDPLLVYRYIVGALLAIFSLLLVVHCLSCVAAPLGVWNFGAGFARLSFGDKCLVIGLSSIPLVLSWWFIFAIWQILPNRRVNAFYLRTFASDRTTLYVRQDAQNALGRSFRLSGIRDPRRRWPMVVRWILAIVLVFRYCTPKYMDLEAGHNWKARLWRSLGDARCAFIDVSTMTSYVMEEVELCVRCLGIERVLFVGDQARDEDGWKEYVRGMLPASYARNTVQVAIWTGTREGRQAFRARVTRFADGLPEGAAGVNMDALGLTTNAALPEEGKNSYHGALGWLEVILGWVVSTLVFFLVGFLPALGGPGKMIYLAILLAFGVLFFWSFACYVINCGPGYRRNFALAAIGGPFLALLVLIGLFVPAAQNMRAAAERTQSSNNLKQIGLAAQGYHNANKRFPAGALLDEQGRALHGWETLLLPYLDQAPLYHSINLKKPWDAPENVGVMKVPLQVFLSPAVQQSSTDRFGMCHYAANVHVMGPRSLPMAAITDGTSYTMLAGDVSSNFKPWGMPANGRDPALGLHTSPESFGGPQAKVSLLVMCDGTVRFVRNDISIDVMKAIATPNGNEPIGLGELDR